MTKRSHKPIWCKFCDDIGPNGLRRNQIILHLKRWHGFSIDNHAGAATENAGFRFSRGEEIDPSRPKSDYTASKKLRKRISKEPIRDAGAPFVPCKKKPRKSRQAVAPATVSDVSPSEVGAEQSTITELASNFEKVQVPTSASTVAASNESTALTPQPFEIVVVPTIVAATVDENGPSELTPRISRAEPEPTQEAKPLR